MDEEERLMPDDPCDHITDTTGWITNDRKKRSGAGEVLRVDAVEDAPRRPQGKKFIGFRLSD